MVRLPFCQFLTIDYRDIGIAFIIKEFHQVKAITLIVIITYYHYIFKSFCWGIIFSHQLLKTYDRNIGVAVSVKDFHLVKDTKLIVMIDYYF